MPGRGIFKLGIAGRAVSPVFTFGGEAAGPQIIDRRREVTLIELYELAQNCNAVRKSIQSLRDYTFREGIEWKPKWSKSCTKCNKKYPPQSKPDVCDKCGNMEFKEPEDDSVRKIEDKFFRRRVDRNGHTFIEVLKMYEDHLNTADDAFLMINKDYDLAEDGTIRGWTIKELFVPDTRNFKLVQDPVTHTPGGKFFICLRHRPVSEWALRKMLEKDPNYQRGRVYGQPGKCQECGSRLYDVWYVSTHPGMTGTGSSESVAEYYIGDVELPDGRISCEVIHTQKYSGSYGYGYAPLISVYDKSKALMSMERYIRTFYEEERTPRAGLFIPTRNPASVQQAFKDAEDKNVSQGGHYIPKFTFDPGDSGGSRAVQYIEFSKLPAELQFMEYMDECYRRIGSAFGVAPVFHGNVDAVGLQNQGPTQWTITTDAAQLAQSMYNDKMFPILIEQFGIVDFDLRLKPPRSEDSMKQWNEKQAEVMWAQGMKGLGFRVLGIDLEGHIEISQTPTDDQSMGMFGSAQGMGNQMGGGGGGMPGGQMGGQGGPQGPAGGSNGQQPKPASPQMTGG